MFAFQEWYWNKHFNSWLFVCATPFLKTSSISSWDVIESNDNYNKTLSNRRLFGRRWREAVSTPTLIRLWIPYFVCCNSVWSSRYNESIAPLNRRLNSSFGCSSSHMNLFKSKFEFSLKSPETRQTIWVTGKVSEIFMMWQDCPMHNNFEDYLHTSPSL